VTQGGAATRGLVGSTEAVTRDSTTATATAGGSSGGRESAVALAHRFGPAIRRVHESCGQVIVVVESARAHEVLGWLFHDPDHQFDYLADLTCVEYRDPERPLEVVYQLRSMGRAADLRLKILLDPEGPLEVRTVTDLWIGADWLEREAWDMFGVRFRGHPDLRRILMWESYDEGHPLRKSFPLRGHRSRSEQTRQALDANPEAHYSMEELSIAEAYRELPQEMRRRLAPAADDEAAR
jgi:NADH-quinone oxidoreductase subunit C